jgi:hypothetical protein
VPLNSSSPALGKETEVLRRRLAASAARNVALEDALRRANAEAAGAPIESLLFDLAQAFTSANQALLGSGQPGEPRFVVSGAEASLPVIFEWRKGRLLATLVDPASTVNDANRIGSMRLRLGHLPGAPGK